MSIYVTYDVVIVKTIDNDGWTFVRRGSEPRTESKPIHEAVEDWRIDGIIAALERALHVARAKKGA